MKRWAELALLLAGVFLLGSAGWKILKYDAFQAHPDWFSAPAGPVQPPLSESFGVLCRRVLLSATQTPATAVRVVGRLEIPRLGVSVVIVDGDDEGSLDLGAGHVPGTAPIGASGNVVIAGHRDTVFRALRRIRIGDRVRIETTQIYTYAVESSKIVTPDDIGVLQGDGTPLLTMITCYPFGYIGDAPKRFIVRARKSGT